MNLTQAAQNFLSQHHVDGHLANIIRDLNEKFCDLSYIVDVESDVDSGLLTLMLLVYLDSTVDISAIRNIAKPHRGIIAELGVSFYVGEAA